MAIGLEADATAKHLIAILQVEVLDELFGGLTTIRLGHTLIDFSTRIPWRSRTSLEHARREEVYENQVVVALSVTTSRGYCSHALRVRDTPTHKCGAVAGFPC